MFFLSLEILSENSTNFPALLQSIVTCSKSTKKNTRKRYEICWKLIIKIPERRPWSLSGVFIVNPIQVGRFGSAHGCHTYPTMMKLSTVIHDT